MKDTMDLRDALKDKLTKKEMDRLKTAFDSVGGIAILEIPPELEKKERLVGETLLAMHRNITTVVKKAGGHEGELRIQKVVHLAGEKTTIAHHKESGCVLELDIEKVYFSVRLGTERLRIAHLVRSGEDILVMFSGCAPYPCVLSRNTKAKRIVGVELNPVGQMFGVRNVEINNLKNVTLVQGDVRKVVPKLCKTRKFDRVLMPLPKSAEDFLDVAIAATKKGGFIHFYDFLPEDDIPMASLDKIGKACKKAKRDWRMLSWTKCGSNAPRRWRVCVDVQIL